MFNYKPGSLTCAEVEVDTSLGLFLITRLVYHFPRKLSSIL